MNNFCAVLLLILLTALIAGCASVTQTYLETPTPREEYIRVSGEGADWQEAVDKALRKAVDHFGVDIKSEELIVNRRLVGEAVQINRDGWITEYMILSEEKREDKIVVAMQVLVIAKEDIENRKRLKKANQQVVGGINTVGGRDGVGANKILERLEKKKIPVFSEIKKLARLREMKIIEATGRSEDDIDSPASLLRSSFRLSAGFLNRLYNGNKEPNDAAVEAEGYKDNLDYLADQFERIRILRDRRSEFPRWMREDGTAKKKQSEELKKLEARIADRLQKTNKSFPFEEFKKKKGLNLKEELIILALLRNEEIYRDQYTIEELLDVISQTPYERLVDRRLLKKDGRLIKKKIIEPSASSRFIGVNFSSIKLNENLKAKLLGEKKKNERHKLKSDRFFEIVKPSVSFDKVVLHPKTNEELRLAIEKIKGNTSNLLYEWGIKNSLQSTEIKKKKPALSVIMLFYGPPGTGKTLAANAAAHTLNRELITFDCSKILSCWVGESEQNSRRIFDKYRAISKGMKRPPVLVLNEADQFLHKRINAARSVDHMYNQMQNIFLEQLERFDGILIATTNLLENLDSAFSRRFQHKIGFRRPGQEERLKLWQIHIPEKAPLSDDADLQHLSEHYDLSGGQISVAVQNAAARAAMRGDKIYQKDLIDACDEEMAGNFDEKARLKIGF